MTHTTEIPGVHWYLDCEPRLVQLEALARSYTGKAYRTSKEDTDPVSEPLFTLKNAGMAARGFPFFMEMRLGKTPTVLNEFVCFRNDYSFERMLVISPSKYKGAWGLEPLRFGYDRLQIPVHVFESSDKGRKAAAAFVAKGRGLLVVNYEALLYDNNMAILGDWVNNRTYVAADESVMMKDKGSLFFKRANDLAIYAGVSRPMTGKPVVQGPHDLYSQLRFARLLEGTLFTAFKKRYCAVGGFKGKAIIGTQNEEELYRKLRQVSFIAQRRHWGTWIEPDYVERKVGMNAEQTEAYRSMEDDFITWLADGSSVSVEQVITKRMKMQQISSGFIYDEQKKTHWITPFDKTPKYKALFEDLETEISGKAIVVAVFRPSVEALYDELSKHYGVAIIARGYGDPEEQKARFNNDPSCRIMVAQEQSVKYGHTLMGTKEDPCLNMCYFENSYSLDDRAQSIERPQGEGQVAGITIMDYFSGGVEGDVIRALQRKESVSAAVFDYYRKESK